MVGTVIGWCFAGLGLLLLLLLLVPVAVSVDLTGGALRVWVRVLFVRLQLWPRKPGRPGRAKPVKAKKPRPAKEKPEKPKKQRSLEDTLNLVKRLASAAGKAMRVVLRGLRVKQVDIVLPVRGTDAAVVAVRTGQVHALLGGTRAALENILTIRWRRIVVVPDFAGLAPPAHFSCKITAPPVIMLVAGVAGLWQFAFWKKRGYTLAEYRAYQLEKRAQRRNGTNGNGGSAA